MIIGEFFQFDERPDFRKDHLYWQYVLHGKIGCGFYLDNSVNSADENQAHGVFNKTRIKSCLLNLP